MIHSLRALFSIPWRIPIFLAILGNLTLLSFLGKAVMAGELNERLRVTHFSILEGLSQNSISSIIQDSSGFLWVATTDGLNRYDGYEFLVFKPGNKNAQGMISSDINKVIEDSQQTIWIATGLGAQFYNSKQQTFETLTFVPSNPEMQLRVHDLIDWAGHLYFATDKGIFVLDQADKTLTFVDTKTPVTQLIPQQSTKTLWFTGREGLYYLNLETGKIKLESEISSSIGARAVFRTTKMLFGDPNEQLLWIASRDGLFQVNLPDRLVRRYTSDASGIDKLSDDFVQDLLMIDNELWVGTANGLNKIALESGEITRYYADVRDRQGLSGNDITVLFQDNSGLVWIGTFDQGLNRWNPHHQNFNHFLNRADIDNLSGSNYAKSMMIDKQNRLWIGTPADGIFIIDELAKTIENIAESKNEEPTLVNNEITSLIQAYQGDIWVASKFHGISRLSPKGKVIKNYRFDNGLLVSAIYEDRLARIWITTNRGLSLYDATSDSFVEKTLLPIKTSARVIHQGIDDAYWVGSRHGLYRLELGVDSNQIVKFEHENANSNSLDSSVVYDVAEDDEGNIWVATERGLNKITRDGEKKFSVDRVFERLGYSGAWVNSVLATKNKSIWMGTNNGLKRFDMDSERVSTFNHKDGLATVDFFVRNATIGKEDHFYFGGANGVERFNPDKLSFHRFEAPLMFTKLEIEGKSRALFKTNQTMVNLQLPHDYKTASFSFSLLDFSDPASNSYRYRIDEENWIDLGKKNYINLTHLQTGRYHLEISAFGPMATASSNKLQVAINVKRPFYQSQIFKMSYIGLILFAIVYFYYRQKSVQKGYFSRIEATLLEERKQHIKLHTEYKRLELKMEKLDAQISQKDNTIRLIKKKYNDLQGLDSVTGLRKKHTLTEHIHAELDKARLDYETKGRDSRQLAVILIDIDGFHYIQDNYGFLSGENVLAQFANLLRGACRGSDSIFRWSEQQFLVITYFIADQELTDLAERIRSIVSARPFDLGNGGKTDITCCLGFATYPFFLNAPELVEWELMLDLCEQALVAAKRSSPNAWIGMRGAQVKDTKLFLRNVSYDIVAFINSGEIRVFTSFADPSAIDWLVGDTSETY